MTYDDDDEEEGGPYECMMTMIPQGSTHVKNLKVKIVASEEEALQMLFVGQTNRSVANHYLNRNSTRGHAVFTLFLQIKLHLQRCIV